MSDKMGIVVSIPEFELLDWMDIDMVQEAVMDVVRDISDGELVYDYGLTLDSVKVEDGDVKLFTSAYVERDW